MRMIMTGVAAAALLAGCGEDAAQRAEKEAPAKALTPGEYEVVTEVDKIRSTDQATPATKSEPGGEATTARTCIPADGTIDPALFVEAGETCNAMDNYMRGGRMSLQYKCQRPGHGELTHLVDGDFKSDGFETKVITSTYFAGSGDYELTRTMTGKRVGECPPAGQQPAEQNAAEQQATP